MSLDTARLDTALDTARTALLAERVAEGHWEGELSSSALSTAVACAAMQHVQTATGAEEHDSLIQGGLHWLAQHANADGGWGDTTKSLSNISTTTLCWATFHAVPGALEEHAEVVAAAEQWLTKAAGGVTPDYLAPAIIARYGKDRTFSVPILTHCALAGKGRWKDVIQLPFELAALPRNWFAALRLPVVSYALPALIAIGQCRHQHRPSWNPFTRVLRNAAREKTLQVLEQIQPSNGGFLEATPLTSFVTMSLAGCGLPDHPVARKGIEFLHASVRADGSWPIDTHLATWVTTLSVNALGEDLPDDARAPIRGWLLKQQYREVHPFTDAAPG
ncbi:MAG: squalene--hopene cyclase, partial [Limisphaerales bacterium]